MVFEGACVSCHGWSGESAISPMATLTGAWAVNDPAATNVAQIVISGTKRHTPDGALSMPAFGNAYTDDEIAAVANYVTARFGAKGSKADGERRGGAAQAGATESLGGSAQNPGTAAQACRRPAPARSAARSPVASSVSTATPLSVATPSAGSKRPEGMPVVKRCSGSSFCMPMIES